MSFVFFHSVTPEDPLTAIEMTQANFSWKRSDDSPPESETEDGSQSGSLYLHSVNLSVKKVCRILT